jgi:hypothetical protein
MKPAEKGRVVSVRTDGLALHYHSASRAWIIAGLAGFFIPRRARAVGRAQPLRYDALQAHLAGLPEDRGAVLVGVLADHEAELVLHLNHSGLFMRRRVRVVPNSAAMLPRFDANSIKPFGQIGQWRRLSAGRSAEKICAPWPACLERHPTRS